jgi:hypothetical protein
MAQRAVYNHKQDGCDCAESKGVLPDFATLLAAKNKPEISTPTENAQQVESPRIPLHSRRKRRREEERDKTDESPKCDPPSDDQKNVWERVPQTSSKDKQAILLKRLDKDPKTCRLCADTFCKDETYGDPHLIRCVGCGDHYHTFCINNKPMKNDKWKCYKCSGLQPPKIPIVNDTNPNLCCLLCQRPNKGIEGRLIGPFRSLGDTTNNFIHENCAFYSKGVVKINDRWYCLPSAVRNSHQMKCSFCNKKGASIPCDFQKCRKIFHYGCAKRNGCAVVTDTTGMQQLFCDKHVEAAKIHGPLGAKGEESTPPLVIPDSPPSPEPKKKKFSEERIRETISRPSKGTARI